MDLDETALKDEINRIADKIDGIMAKVNRLYPLQELKSPSKNNVPRNADETPNVS